MTTIACDGVSLAADRASWFGDVVIPKTKLRRILWNGDSVLVAGCGLSSRIAHLIRYLEDGTVPAFTSDDEPTLVVMLAPSGIYTLDCDMWLAQIETPFFGGGMGGSMAHGALAAGASARRAVQIVLDHGSGAAVGVDSEVL